MTPQEYMNEIVLPTVMDAQTHVRSRRHLYLACIVTFHLKDHLQKTGEINIEGNIRNECGENFDVVRSICNGAKHVNTDKSHSIQFRAGDDWDRPPAECGLMVCGLSQLGDHIGGREIQNSHLVRKDVYWSLKAVICAFCKCYPDHFDKINLAEIK